MDIAELVEVSLELDNRGLLWRPEIGDEVTLRESPERVSILVDPQGLTLTELRQHYLWLPNVEQLVSQLEERGAIVYHIGFVDNSHYEVIVRAVDGVIESDAVNLRVALCRALGDLLDTSKYIAIH